MKKSSKRKSLLYKSLSRYVICTVMVLLVCLPLFYLLTKLFYAEEIADLIISVQQGGGIPALDLEQDILTGVMIQFALIILILTVSSVVAMRFVFKHLWAPFEDTLQKAETFNVEKEEVPTFSETDVKEFALLNASITQLMERSVESFRNQKEFTENASHELQTPIAIVQSKLDVLLQEDLNERQLHLVQELYEVGSRMARLNKSLLLLAKIDNSQYQLRERVDVRKMLEKSKQTFADLYDRQDLDYRLQACTVMANPSLMEIMINNLLVNSLRHTSAEGKVSVVCSARELHVLNTAQGGALEESKIFNRFNHSADANRGTGIGLAIVKAISDYHGWKLSYRFMDGNHCFSVKFTSKA